MPIQPFHPTITGELCAPFDCDEQALNALATVGAFVALADGQVEVIERDEGWITSIGGGLLGQSQHSASLTSLTNACDISGTETLRN